MTLLNSSCQAAIRLPSLAAYLAERVRCSPTAIALEHGSRRLSYSTLNDRTNRLANGLADKGLRAGDRVAVVSENCLEYLELKLAAAKLGVAVACQNWRQAAPELSYCLKLAAPAMVVVSKRFASEVEAIVPGVDLLVIGQAYEALLSRSSAHEVDRDPDPELPFTLLYTSGTTGLPKAAVISQ
ncbi:MAG: AMP-binding protein, partial [Pigmentiphaga sp.]